MAWPGHLLQFQNVPPSCPQDSRTRCFRAMKVLLGHGHRCAPGSTPGWPLELPTTYLLGSELLHQPLLLPQHLVLLTELPQQLLYPGGKEKGRRG